MEIQTILPLLSTIAGGVLAIIGGFTASHLTLKIGRERDRQNIRRQKLEEAYLLSIQVDEGIQQDMGEIASGQRNKNNSEKPIDQLIMLTACYGEESGAFAEKLEAAIDDMRNLSFEYYKEMVNTGKKPSETTFKKIGIPFELSRELSTELKLKIRDEIRKNA